MLTGIGDPIPEELAKLDPNLIEQICNEIIDNGGRIVWEDIAGQQAAKKLIQEVVVWPMLNPQIFQVQTNIPYSMYYSYILFDVCCFD